MEKETDSNSELVPVVVTSQKHDPAWKHCEMYKNGARFELKCNFCGKVFKGGGIHRIKEHLAGQKGNASSCLRVPPDVRLSMQESLRGVVMKKRRKRKVAEEVATIDNVVISSLTDVDALAMDASNYDNCGINTEVDMDAVGQDCNVFESGEVVIGNKANVRKKKGRVGKADVSAQANATSLAFGNNAALGSKKVNSHVHIAIGRFFFDAGVPLDAVNSIYFQPMIDAISSQVDRVVGPSYNDLRSWILKSAVQEVRNDVDKCTSSWGKSGCSLLVDEWLSDHGRSFASFSIYSSQGTTFLRSADISDIQDSEDSLFELLKQVVEEVGVRNVLQVITIGEDRYIGPRKRITDAYPTIFWTPCTAHCVDLMLQDISKLEWIKISLEQAKMISRFIYNNNVVLNMMRRHTFGVDLVDLGVTRSATDFMTLKRLVNIRQNLTNMVTSDEWMESQYTKEPEGCKVSEHISDQSYWSTCILLIRLVDPLLRLLRIVSSKKRPGVAYAYAGVYRAKEIIKKEFPDKNVYSIYWDIIDRRWEPLRRHPLLAAGFYLNPKFSNSAPDDLLLRTRSLVFDCVEKLVTDPNVQDKVVKEINSYQDGAGDFGRMMAVRARDNLPPVEWWSTYGGGCPNLARLAIRILSQTCSLISCNRSRVVVEKLHATENRLEHQRLNDLVFVQTNLRLKQMAQGNKEQDTLDPISHEHSSLAADWVIKPLCSEDTECSDWMTVDPPLGNTMLLGTPVDDVEALGTGFDDYEIFNVIEETRGENEGLSLQNGGK